MGLRVPGGAGSGKASAGLAWAAAASWRRRGGETGREAEEEGGEDGCGPEGAAARLGRGPLRSP